jgi:putative heme-binding domain-containing protein
VVAFVVMILSSLVAAQAAGQSPRSPGGPATRPAASRYESFAMSHLGDPSRGRALFFNPSRLACTQCHSAEPDGRETKVGPGLYAIGDKFGRRELIEAIVSPSASIAVGYSSTTVRTRDGDVLQGILKESTDAGIALMQSDGMLAHLARGEIVEQRTSDVSMMPEGLQAGLSLQEFADLVEYLASLKLPETAAAVGHGMPTTVAELARPVGFVPFTAEKFEHPVWFGPVPGLAGTFAVEEHETGKIWFLRPGGGAHAKTLFVDTGRFLTGTRGLVGLAFHPRFAENGRYYFVKHLVTDGRFRTVLYRGEADATRTRDSGRPATVVLRVDMSSNVHFGGGLQFGTGGYLYVGIGDTGPQGDPHGNAQNMGLVAGKLLRIDVDRAEAGKSYAVPADNPFVGREGVRPEIWGSGLRMAWRFSFDPLTNDLWEGDVGQDLFEEVNLIRRGGNYGWNVFEGFEPYSNKYRRPGENYVPPVFAYTRKYGPSVTGGFVYRGDPASPFYGAYIFGDYQTARIFCLTQEGGVLKQVRQIGKCPQHAVSFGRDDRGELYVVGYEGTIYRLDLTRAAWK